MEFISTIQASAPLDAKKARELNGLVEDDRLAEEELIRARKEYGRTF